MGSVQLRPTLQSLFGSLWRKTRPSQGCGKVADMWRWTSGSLGHFIDLPPAQSGRKPTLVQFGPFYTHSGPADTATKSE